MSSSISKNIFWLTISRVVALVFLFIAYTRLFRYLDPYCSGKYQFVLSYVLIFATIVDFGIQQFITKKISEDPGNTIKYFREFFSFEIFAAFSLYILLVVLAYFKGYDREVFYAICLAGLGLVANALTYPYLAVMAAFQDMRKVALINFINSLVNIAVIFSAIIFRKHIVYLASVQLIFGIIDLIIYRVFIIKHLPKPGILAAIFNFNLKPIWNILKQGWPFALLVGFSAIYNRIDVLLITFLKGYEQTGYYTAAYKIFDLLGFFPSVVSYTLFPFFAGLMSKNALLEVRENLEKYLKLMILAALPMAVGGTILSAKLIALVAGPEYAPAASVLAVLIWAPAILFIYIPANSLVISQLTKKALIVTGANVAINTLGNLILLPRFGIMAAAVMTVLSELVQGVFYFYFINKHIVEFSFKGLWFKPFVSAVVMGSVLWTLRSHSLIYTLPSGVVVYALMLLLTGYVRKSDILLVKNLLKPS